MNHFDDEPVRVSILGVVGRLTCAQENEVYLRLLKVPEYLEAYALDRLFDGAGANPNLPKDCLREWSARRANLNPILCPIVAKLMHEVTQ